MSQNAAPASEFADEVKRPDYEIDLGRAALLIARLRYPALNVERELLRLDALADRVRVRAGTHAQAAEIATCLFGHFKFRGNAEAYSEDANSFLNDVLDRRLGIPISLGVLHIEIARRLGCVVEPIGMPGHFLTSAVDGAGRVFFDCFDGGRALREEDCASLLAQVTSGAHTFRRAMLQPISRRHVLTRMLGNLKGIYVQSRLWSMLVGVTQLLLTLDPNDASEQRNLGVALVNAGRYRHGLEAINRYLESNPSAEDAKTMRQYAIELAERVARWN